MFAKLKDICLWESDSAEFLTLLEHAINCIYFLADHPDRICGEMLKEKTRLVFESHDVADNIMDVDGQDEEAQHDEQEIPNTEHDPNQLDDALQQELPVSQKTVTLLPSQRAIQPENAIDSWKLAQLCFLVGHVAIKQIVFLESIEAEWKRRNVANEANEAKGQYRRQAKERRRSILTHLFWKGSGKPTPCATPRVTPLATPRSLRPATPVSAGDNELQQSVGMTEDEFGDVVAFVREKELLYSQKSLLSLWPDARRYLFKQCFHV